MFHAAALKHLPLLESYPAEALKSNVWGTVTVLEAAADHGVQSLVNISTDKAPSPVSVLGYSKRIAERLLVYMSAKAVRLLRQSQPVFLRAAAAPGVHAGRAAGAVCAGRHEG